MINPSYYDSGYWKIQRDRSIGVIIVCVAMIGVSALAWRQYGLEVKMMLRLWLVPLGGIFLFGFQSLYAGRRYRNELVREQAE